MVALLVQCLNQLVATLKIHEKTQDVSVILLSFTGLI